MKELIRFFTPNTEMSLFDEQKTRAFIFLSLSGIAIVIFLIIRVVSSQDENYIVSLISAIALGVFVLINLFILKVYGIKIAGNILSLGLVILLLIALSILSDKVPAIYKFVQGFYTILALLSVGVLFASRYILIINAILILITTTRVLFFSLEQSPEQASLLRAAYTNHTISLVIISMMLYFAIQFAKNAIDAAMQDASIKEAQNKKLNSISRQIKNSAANLNQMSSQISLSANSLSSNSSEQAANVEEISAAIEQVVSSIIQNAENTSSTSKYVEKSFEFIKKAIR
ncbi:MAG: methyl-accepting chemotaxis protein [Bacteroidales bacterium]|nr:methyl-accepting chemotaxis protein [Bacteroidales bacterium]